MFKFTATFNVNDLATVRLTEDGIQQFVKFHGWSDLPETWRVRYTAEDGSFVLTAPLWEVINIFGSSRGIGEKGAFVDNEIEITKVRGKHE